MEKQDVTFLKPLMKRLVPVGIIFCLLSCSKPIEAESLPATLQAIISNSEPGCLCLPYINKYKWKGATVYMQGYRGPACNWTPAYYNFKGEPIVMPAEYTLDKFLVESLLVEMVWKCE
jgi:hypothetical protein